MVERVGGSRPTNGDYANQHQFSKEAGKLPGGFPSQKIYDAKQPLDFEATAGFHNKSSDKVNSFVNARHF